MFNMALFFRFIVMVNILPETEGRSLENIELHYADNTKGLTDINIPVDDKLTKQISDKK